MIPLIATKMRFLLKWRASRTIRHQCLTIHKHPSLRCQTKIRISLIPNTCRKRTNYNQFLPHTKFNRFPTCSGIHYKRMRSWQSRWESGTQTKKKIILHPELSSKSPIWSNRINVPSRLVNSMLTKLQRSLSLYPMMNLSSTWCRIVQTTQTLTYQRPIAWTDFLASSSWTWRVEIALSITARLVLQMNNMQLIRSTMAYQ